MMENDQKVALKAIGVNLGLFYMKYLFARYSGSIALMAEAFHSLSDVIAPSTVFGGLILARRKTRSFPYGLLIDGIRVLLDASSDYSTLSSTEKLILSESQVSEIQNLTCRNSGRYKIIEADIVLNTNDFDKANFILTLKTWSSGLGHR